MGNKAPQLLAEVPIVQEALNDEEVIKIIRNCIGCTCSGELPSTKLVLRTSEGAESNNARLLSRRSTTGTTPRMLLPRKKRTPSIDKGVRTRSPSNTPPTRVHFSYSKGSAKKHFAEDAPTPSQVAAVDLLSITMESEDVTFEENDTASEVAKKLIKSKIPHTKLQNFSGKDLFALSKEDVIQLLGNVQGIRLHNKLSLSNINTAPNFEHRMSRPPITEVVSHEDILMDEPDDTSRTIAQKKHSKTFGGIHLFAKKKSLVPQEALNKKPPLTRASSRRNRARVVTNAESHSYHEETLTRVEVKNAIAKKKAATAMDILGQRYGGNPTGSAPDPEKQAFHSRQESMFLRSTETIVVKKSVYHEEGWLRVRTSNILDTWPLRYFVLDPKRAMLSHFKTTNTISKPLGWIPIIKIISCKTRLGDETRIEIKFTGKKGVQSTSLLADDWLKAKVWVQKINTVLDQIQPTGSKKKKVAVLSVVPKAEMKFYDQIVALMLLTLSISEKSYWGKSFPLVFTGKDAVKWFIHNKFCNNKNDAQSLGNRMMDAGIFYHVPRSKKEEGVPFADRSYFYRFNKHEESDHTGKELVETTRTSVYMDDKQMKDFAKDTPELARTKTKEEQKTVSTDQSNTTAATKPELQTEEAVKDTPSAQIPVGVAPHDNKWRDIQIKPLILILASLGVNNLQGVSTVCRRWQGYAEDVKDMLEENSDDDSSDDESGESDSEHIKGDMPVVIDCGAHMLRAGFAGEDLPSVIIRMKSKYDPLIDTPKNWEIMRSNLEQVYEKLGVDSSQHPVLISQPVRAPVAFKEKLEELLFENFEAPAVLVELAPVLSAYSYGYFDGLCIDIGATACQIVPIVQGLMIEHAVTRVRHLSGRTQTKKLFDTLRKKDPNTPNLSLEYAMKIKEEVGYIAYDYDKALSLPANYGKEYDNLKLHKELLDCGEIMFRPRQMLNDLDESIVSLQELIKNAIEECDIDVRRELLSRILLSGGGSEQQGLAERLQKELVKEMPHVVDSIRIIPNHPHKKHAVWNGGSLFANHPEMFQKTCVPKWQYEER